MSSMNELINKKKREVFQLPALPPLKYPIEKEPVRLTPREFCRKMYGLSELPEIDILRTEMHPDYRKRCVALLTKALGVQRQSVLNWGGGMEFYKMPIAYHRSLGICWELYELRAEVKRLRRFSP